MIDNELERILNIAVVTLSRYWHLLRGTKENHGKAQNSLCPG
jgi:hypothetical protein